MPFASRILDLVSDDHYLLWEIKAELVSEASDNFEGAIAEVIALVNSHQISCYVRPVISKSPMQKVTIAEAVKMLSEKENWYPPKSDFTDVVWLGLNDNR